MKSGVAAVMHQTGSDQGALLHAAELEVFDREIG
jgi:hypothetical protein